MHDHNDLCMVPFLLLFLGCNIPADIKNTGFEKKSVGPTLCSKKYIIFANR